MMKGQPKTLQIPSIANSETSLTDHEDEQIEHKSQPTNTTDHKENKHHIWSSIESWLKTYNLERLEHHLIKQDLFSFEKMQELAISDDWKQQVAMIVKETGIAASFNSDETLELESKFESGLNALLINTLDKTDDFLSKLNQLCKEKITSENDQEWVLILIDCDDIGVLLHDKKITTQQAQNSINLLNANICRIIDKHNCQDDNNNMFGYHLGSDLFSLFVYDNKNTMNKSIEIVEYLLGVMRNKNKSSFTISVGMSVRALKDSADVTLEQNGKQMDDIESTQREWVLNANTNLLRAKENGKNCYFNIGNVIDPSEDFKELSSITEQVNKLHTDLYVDKCENLIDICLNKFDQDAIIKQTITTQNCQRMRSIYYIKALIIFGRNFHIGNAKYRGYAAKKWVDLSMKTFILGNMSVECYYLYKMRQIMFKESLDTSYRERSIKISQQRKARMKTINDKDENKDKDKDKDKDNDSTSSNYNLFKIGEKYDLTLLTRKRSADVVVAPVIKGTPLYYSKSAFEHLSDTSDAPNIGFVFAWDVGKLGKKAYNYQKQLYQQVIKCDPNYGMARNNLVHTLWSLKEYNECLDFIEESIKTIPGNTWLLWSCGEKYQQSCEKQVKIENATLTRDERLGKAMEYGQQMLDISENNGKIMIRGMYSFYGSLLYAWSKDFDKNKKEQRLALKMYDKSIKLDQQFGYDIIKNWIRDFDKFEHELINIIVSYWYLPNKSMQNDILDCADLIETHFNHDEQKMKRAKILSNIVPDGGNVIRFMATDITNKRACYYVSIRKPGKKDHALASDRESFNWDEFGSVVASWYLDEGLGGVNNNNANNETEEMTKFSRPFAAKLAYFFTFWKYYEDFINNELRLSIDLFKRVRIVMIKLLIHYGFKLWKREHSNFVEMIRDSWKMTNMVRRGQIRYVLTVSELGLICNKIEKIIDMEDEQVILNTKKIIAPYIVSKNRK